MSPLRTLPLALVVALVVVPVPAGAQRYPAYFDDFTYARVGTPQDGPAADALLGANEWLVGPGREAMRSWRLGFDDDTHTGSATAYFGGPSTLRLLGAGAGRRLQLYMDAGFPADPSRYVHPPLLETGQLFDHGGTFAARVRFSTLEEGQEMVEAFWLFSADQYRFCPPDTPGCDVRTAPPGTLSHADEMDFEFNNAFLAEPVSNVVTTAIRYREIGDASDYGANSAPLNCVDTSLHPLCIEGGESLWPGRWYLLLFRLDPATGAVAFEAVEDEPGPAPGARRAVAPDGDAPFVARRTRGRPADGGRRAVAPEPFLPRAPLSIMLSLHYSGPYRSATSPCTAADGHPATCRPHTLDVDWVYQSSRLLAPGAVRREVNAFRSRGIGRANTLGLLPGVVEPEHAAAGADSARLVLVLDGPRATAQTASWTVRPAHVRGIIYRMDVEVETRCAPGARACRPRLLHPRDLRFTLTPAPGEAGMTVRAKLRDPWNGFTHVPSPGSDWTEWEVRFTDR